MVKVFGLFDLDFYWTLSPLCGFLWAAGGTGPKLLRRIGVTGSISAYAWAYGLKNTFILLPLLFIAFGPGYGDEKQNSLKRWYWPYVFLLGLLYGACLFGLCFHFGRWDYLGIGSLACSFVFGGTLLWSRKSRKPPPWKICEILTGSAVGLTASLIIGG